MGASGLKRFEQLLRERVEQFSQLLLALLEVSVEEGHELAGVSRGLTGT